MQNPTQIPTQIPTQKASHGQISGGDLRKFETK